MVPATPANEVASVDEVVSALYDQDYLADEGLATAIYLALRLHRPLLLEGEGDFLAMVPGTFIILGPQDAHMPQIAAGAPGEVRKVVIKVAV